MRRIRVKAKLPRRFLGVLCLTAAVFFLAPLIFGIAHIGMVWPAAALLWWSGWLLLPQRMGRLPRWLRVSGNYVSAGCVIAAAALAALMVLSAANRPPAEEETDTVIVLGCQVYDGRPSVMLQRRIDAAYDYLTAHPHSICVCSGGMDDNETVTEADCIADTLIAMGIDPSRLYREDLSRSTAENLAFSNVLIVQKHLSPTVVIATDAFHEFRAASFARQNGLIPYAAPCRSPWYLAPGYWCREMVGILAMWIRGY